MYRNINNYYFSRPNSGYAYGNPYRLNFSRSYPRVVIYNGQQNFELPKWFKKLGTVAGLSAALNPIGSGIGRGLGHVASESGIVKTNSDGTITMPNPKFDIKDWGVTAPDGSKYVEYVETSADNPDLVELSPYAKLMSPESVRTMLLGEKSPKTHIRNKSLFIQTPSSDPVVGTVMNTGRNLAQRDKLSEQASLAQNHFDTDKRFRQVPVDSEQSKYISSIIPPYYPKKEKPSSQTN